MPHNLDFTCITLMYNRDAFLLRCSCSGSSVFLPHLKPSLVLCATEQAPMLCFAPTSLTGKLFLLKTFFCTYLMAVLPQHLVLGDKVLLWEPSPVKVNTFLKTSLLSLEMVVAEGDNQRIGACRGGQGACCCLILFLASRRHLCATPLVQILEFHDSSLTA